MRDTTVYYVPRRKVHAAVTVVKIFPVKSLTNVLNDLGLMPDLHAGSHVFPPTTIQ